MKVAQDVLSNLSYRPLFPTERDMRLFVNREREVQTLMDAVSNRFNVLLLGDRGSGKTTILNHVYHNLSRATKSLVVQINLTSEVSSPNDLLRLLMVGLIRAVNQHQRTTTGPMKKALKLALEVLENAYIPLLPLPTLKTASTKSEENLVIKSSEFGYIIADRFVDLAQQIKKKAIDLTFLIDGADKGAQIFYHAMTQLRESLWRTEASYVVVGDIGQEQVYRKPPLDAFLDKVVRIGPLTFEDSKKLIEVRLEGSFLTEDLMLILFQRSEGNPRALIHFAREILERAPEVGWQNAKVDSQILKSLKHTSFEVSDAIRGLTPRQREIFRYVQVYGPVSASNVDFQSSMGIKRARLVQILKELEKRGLVSSQRVRGATKEKLYTTVLELKT